jgi:hypothetical protein
MFSQILIIAGIILMCLGATEAPGSAAAATLANKDVLHFKNNVVFNHKLHQTERVGLCYVCHGTENEPGKMKNFSKEWAHTYCTDCHELFDEGPTKNNCKGCHGNGN